MKDVDEADGGGVAGKDLRALTDDLQEDKGVTRRKERGFTCTTPQMNSAFADNHNIDCE